MMVSFDQHISIPEGVLLRQLSGEAVILNLNTEHYFGLDAVGTRMWVLLSSSPTIESAFNALLAEYAVDADTLRRDLTDFITNLTKHGLLELD
jgi:hypothetical protein